MWTDRHHMRREMRLKGIVVQAGLDEMVRLAERTYPSSSASATPARQVVVAIDRLASAGRQCLARPAGGRPA